MDSKESAYYCQLLRVASQALASVEFPARASSLPSAAYSVPAGQ